eukprot:gb/GECH01009000.1/.p1 GENE.gb/GECH01009000.1/~~gb/GECH01009000.1/.p1  ORF type:complete len:146 (+),score=16.71 gb/GECH01009000.1/:1-438(+)
MPWLLIIFSVLLSKPKISFSTKKKKSLQKKSSRPSTKLENLKNVADNLVNEQSKQKYLLESKKQRLREFNYQENTLNNVHTQLVQTKAKLEAMVYSEEKRIDRIESMFKKLDHQTTTHRKEVSDLEIEQDKSKLQFSEGLLKFLY